MVVVSAGTTASPARKGEGFVRGLAVLSSEDLDVGGVGFESGFVVLEENFSRPIGEWREASALSSRRHATEDVGHRQDELEADTALFAWIGDSFAQLLEVSTAQKSVQRKCTALSVVEMRSQAGEVQRTTIRAEKLLLAEKFDGKTKMVKHLLLEGIRANYESGLREETVDTFLRMNRLL